MFLEFVGIIYATYAYEYLSQFLFPSRFCGRNVNMLSQGEGDDVIVGIWMQEESQMFICSLFCT